MFSCSEKNVNPEFSALTISLDGKWIEKENRKDTIIFDTKLNSGDRTWFSFRSANEIGGYNRLFSTMYEFKIEDHKISLYNSISSCYCFSDYSFGVDGDQMNIGNFYDASREGKTETFVRLK